MGLYLALIESTPTGPRVYRASPVADEAVGAVQLRHRAGAGWTALLARVEGDVVTIVSTAGMKAETANDPDLHAQLVRAATPGRTKKAGGLRIPRVRIGLS